MTSVKAKLLALKKTYHLSTSDLSVLLGVGRETVRMWEKGVKPSHTKQPLLYEALERVEKAKRHFPVPLSVNQFQRKQYLVDALNDHLPRVSKQNTTAGRPRS